MQTLALGAGPFANLRSVCPERTGQKEELYMNSVYLIVFTGNDVKLLLLLTIRLRGVCFS